MATNEPTLEVDVFPTSEAAKVGLNKVCEHNKSAKVAGHGGQSFCFKCLRESRKETCSKCGRYRKVATRKKGEPLCQQCGCDKEYCSLCGEKKRTNLRLALPDWNLNVKKGLGEHGHKKNGLPICGCCYRKNTVKEARAQGDYAFFNFIKAEAVRKGGSILESFNEKVKLLDEIEDMVPKGRSVGRVREKEICSKCERYRVVNKKTADGEPVCGPCNAVPEYCSLCGKEEQVNFRFALPEWNRNVKLRIGRSGHKKNGLPVCLACAQQKEETKEARKQGDKFFLNYIKEVAAEQGRLPVIEEAIRRIKRIVRDGKLEVH